VSNAVGCVPGSAGTRQALLQGWLLCVGFVRLANVPDLVNEQYFDILLFFQVMAFFIF
jgi:hypothetical protein